MILNNAIANTAGLFITGTDTGVGKTHVTRQILQQLASQSISCVAMKPIASGAKLTVDGLRNDDALLLQQASTVALPYELINPYCFEPAIAPHLAAQQCGVEIKLSVILDAYAELSKLADVIIVEGVGGWQVPLGQSATGLFTIADLALKLQLPVVLVVALRLGCLNHALLSYHSIYNSHCKIAGWVANRPEHAFTSADACVDTLLTNIGAPMLANLPYYQTTGKCAELTVPNDGLFDLDQLQLNY